MSWLTSWGFRKSHTINPASGAGQNYQKRVIAHFGFGVDSDEDVYLNGNCQMDFGDLRFADNTGVTLLDYWIEEKVDGSYAICWVEVIDDLSVYDRRIFIYYGKPGSVSIANGNNTFIFFDDFEIDLSKWTLLGTAVLSTDYAYSGTKSIKISPGALMQHLQVPYGDHAVHTHFYDEISPLSESTVFSNDMGESEVSAIGILNDIAQYEYQLQSVTYNSGVDRTVGWHKFITQCTTNLKQFIIDDIVMPNAGNGNYCPVTFLFNTGMSGLPTYWDTVFMRKWVNLEPNHGDWGIEENEAGYLPALFVAEDIENSISSAPMVLEDMIYSLDQKPLDMEDILATLLGGPPHAPKNFEDMILSLLVNRRILTVEDLMLALSGSLHIPVSYEDVIMALLATRRFRIQPEFIVTVGSFPIIGGSHIIQAGSED